MPKPNLAEFLFISSSYFIKLNATAAELPISFQCEFEILKKPILAKINKHERDESLRVLAGEQEQHMIAVKRHGAIWGPLFFACCTDLSLSSFGRSGSA